MIPSDLLVSAYASGWFPMAVAPGEIRWYSPDPRGIIPARQLPRALAARPRAPQRPLSDRGRPRFRRRHPRVRRGRSKEEDGGTWIERRDHGELLRAAPRRARALGGSVAGRSAGRRRLRRRARRRVFRRIDVSPRDRRVQGRARRAGRAAAQRAGTRCSTSNGSRRIWNASARSKFPGGHICGCSSRRWRSTCEFEGPSR